MIDLSRVIHSHRPKGSIVPERVHDPLPDDEPGDGSPDELREADEKCELGHGDINTEDGDPPDPNIEIRFRGDYRTLQDVFARMKFRG